MLMQRIIEFAVDFDENGVKKRIEENAYKEVVEALKTDVMKNVIRKNYYNGTEFTDFAGKVIGDIFALYKDEIIDKAAQLIAEKAMRTKAWKEKFGDAMEGKEE
jgi:hypothetical protein